MANKKLSYNRKYEGQNKDFRSNRAYVQDKARLGTITLDYKKWKNNPRKYDYPGIDTPGHVFHYTKKIGNKAQYNYKYRKKNWKMR